MQYWIQYYALRASMSKAKKLLDKIRNNPKSVPFDDLDRVLLGC